MLFVHEHTLKQGGQSPSVRLGGRHVHTYVRTSLCISLALKGPCKTGSPRRIQSVNNLWPASARVFLGLPQVSPLLLS